MSGMRSVSRSAGYPSASSSPAAAAACPLASANQDNCACHSFATRQTWRPACPRRRPSAMEL